MIVFNQDAVGTASCLRIEGAQPSSAITFGHHYDGTSWSPTRYLSKAVDSLYRASRDALMNVTEEEAKAGGQRQADYGEGAFGAPTPEQAAAKEQATKDLRAAIFPLGLVTGIGLDYIDAYNNETTRITAYSPTISLGAGSITGVVFEKTCDIGSLGTMKKGQHGLEGILDYYYNNRVSNSAKNISVTKLKIGNTTIDSWVVGISVQPMNFDYRIWQWTLKLAVTPQWDSGLTPSRPA